MNLMQRLFPWLIALLAFAILGSALRDRSAASDYDWDAFGQIPVSASGRTKPLDTVARNNLMIISGRQSLVVDGERLPAIRWFADVVASPESARAQEVFRIDHPDLVELLGFQSPEDGGKKRFSYDDLAPRLQEISKQGNLAFKVDPKARDTFQKQVISLYNRISLYHQIAGAEIPYHIPPMAPDEQWRPLFDIMRVPGFEDTEAVIAWRDIIGQYEAGNAELFNESVSGYLELITPLHKSTLTKSKYEILFNKTKPFYQSLILYVLAFILSGFGFMLSNLAKKEWSVAFWRATMAVLVIACTVHTLGLTFRIVLQGRPPVTNLYSSAIFIGWACVLLGIFLEKIYKIGLAGMVSAVVGFATLIVAHNLANTGDTMEMMQAVLDSNFWLATHVVVVTIGYSCMFLAGFLAIAYILLGVLTNRLRGEGGKAMAKMIYGVICFAAVTSFVGTVLGGIWADQSWGRFWGWDPKENGAVLIVFWALIILHARWGGMIQKRGIAVLAVGGNIVTAWSWFGTNMLGVGLHSYGFIDSAVFWMLLFVISQLLIMAVGLTPWKYWRSFSKRDASHTSTNATPALQ